MPIQSHIDPTLFIIFLHIDTSDYDEEFKLLVESMKPTKGTDITALFAAFRERHRRTLAHERYHFWQGLRLPFLHLYAITTYHSFVLSTRELAKIEEDWRCWADLGASVPLFERLDLKFYISGNRTGQLVLGNEPSWDHEFNLEFSAKEMLECAASIFDYQVACESVAQINDPVRFRRWRKRNPAYLKIFDFLESFLLSDSLALRIILPLINAAFHTSIPERAMFELLARVWGNFVNPRGSTEAFLAQKEPCRWPELFQMWLSELNFDHPISALPENIDLLSGEFFFLDPERIFGITIGVSLLHPFLGPLSIEWHKNSKLVPGLDFLLDFPGYVANESAAKFAFSAEPQLRLFKFFSEHNTDKVFTVGDGLVGPAFQDPCFNEIPAGQFRGLILDLMAAYGAFRRATGAHMADAAQTCCHTDCPNFEANYCNCYPLIPERYEDCGFSERMRDWISANRR